MNLNAGQIAVLKVMAEPRGEVIQPEQYGATKDDLKMLQWYGLAKCFADRLYVSGGIWRITEKGRQALIDLPQQAGPDFTRVTLSPAARDALRLLDSDTAVSMQYAGARNGQPGGVFGVIDALYQTLADIGLVMRGPDGWVITDTGRRALKVKAR